MKLSKLTLACLVATAGLSTVPAVHAEKSDGFEFHGYFRAGFYSVKMMILNVQSSQHQKSV